MNQMTRIIAAPVQGYAARFTTAEFLRMIEAELFGDDKVELIEGELLRTPPPGNEHGRRQAMVVGRLFRVADESLVRAEAGVELEEGTLVGFDAALLRVSVTGNRMLRPDEVTLVVEVAESTLSHDLGIKRRKYAQAGIAIYWVVDGTRSVVHVHADPVEGDYAEIHTVRFGQPLAVPGTDATITLD